MNINSIIVFLIIAIVLYTWIEKDNQSENFYVENDRRRHFRPYNRSIWSNWPYYWWNWWSPYGYTPCVDTASGTLECL